MNLAFLGHLGDPSLIGGVGMGQACMSLMGMSIILGCNSALDTLVSQSAGAGNLKMCGVYLNRARYIMSLMFIPIIILSFYIERILIYANQDPVVAKWTQVYL